MKILKTMQKIPAGTLLVPTLVGSVIHTFCPQVFDIGNPTNMLFTSSGMMVFVGMELFCTGTQMKLKDMGPTLKRGLPFTFVKFIIPYIVSFLILKLFGLDGVFGISFLALTIVLTSCNSALYLGIIQPWADSADNALFSLLTLCALPVLPVLFLCSSSGAGVNWQSVISMLVPFLFGLLLGNLDEDYSELYSKGLQIVFLFLGFQFGSMLNLISAVKNIGAGLLLTGFFYIVTIPSILLFDRKVLKRPGYAGVATCCVAGVALSIPAMAASYSAEYEPYVETAVAQIACSMVLTTFITPFLTDLWMKHLAKKEK